MTEYRVKGTSLKSKLEFVRERFGSEAEEQLKELLKEEGIYLLLDSEWYSYDVFDRLIVAIADRFFGGDLERLVEVGMDSAAKALSSVYGVFGSCRDFHQFLNRIPSLHERFYSVGRIDVETLPAGSGCKIYLRGAPRYAPSDIQVAIGFYLGAARHFGLEAVRHRVVRGESEVAVELSWG